MPTGISNAEWTKVYNNADCWVRKQLPKQTNIEDAKQARQAGSTRDVAIEQLVLKGRLPANFVDANP
jgi:hypothetical protein